MGDIDVGDRNAGRFSSFSSSAFRVGGARLRLRSASPPPETRPNTAHIAAAASAVSAAPATSAAIVSLTTDRVSADAGADANVAARVASSSSSSSPIRSGKCFAETSKNASGGAAARAAAVAPSPGNLAARFMMAELDSTSDTFCVSIAPSTESKTLPPQAFLCRRLSPSAVRARARNMPVFLAHSSRSSRPKTIMSRSFPRHTRGSLRCFFGGGSASPAPPRGQCGCVQAGTRQNGAPPRTGTSARNAGSGSLERAFARLVARA